MASECHQSFHLLVKLEASHDVAVECWMVQFVGKSVKTLEMFKKHHLDFIVSGINKNNF